MTKRDAFWASVATDGDSIRWPTEKAGRTELACRVVGAQIVGAAEHCLAEALSRADGAPPAAGAADYTEKLADAEVLASLSPAQRDAVKRLLRESAYFALYWPLVKVGNLPGAVLDLVVTPVVQDGEDELEPCTLTEMFGAHVLFGNWVEEFADILDVDD